MLGYFLGTFKRERGRVIQYFKSLRVPIIFAGNAYILRLTCTIVRFDTITLYS